ncbi:hypothetical protein PanWU01x14_051080 [Parasponia andersonii]|uniref:Uncharacterized protein n=1 Tax=Parasponia andersonii TaxID=3476 RepID=A0A2P5DLW8_PARAD|nr:hypothetical protein PanWU01x14_051080 [Parasponia andersonii]
MLLSPPVSTTWRTEFQFLSTKLYGKDCLYFPSSTVKWMSKAGKFIIIAGQDLITKHDMINDVQSGVQSRARLTNVAFFNFFM